MITFTSYVFCTLTYGRSETISTLWKRVSTDFNRYHQAIKRLHNSNIQYIRCVEAHEDGYPHLHVILQFSTSLTVNNARYFDSNLYSRWKKLWTCGLSDFKPLQSGTKPVSYLEKYISKFSSSRKTVWKKTMMIVNQNAYVNNNGIVHLLPVARNVVASKKVVTGAEIDSTDIKFYWTNKYCKEFKIKQLSWSRHFRFNDSYPSVPEGHAKKQITLSNILSKKP